MEKVSIANTKQNQKTVSVELDNTIVYLCNMVCDPKVPRREKAEIVLALASITEARAKIVNYFPSTNN